MTILCRFFGLLPLLCLTACSSSKGKFVPPLAPLNVAELAAPFDLVAVNSLAPDIQINLLYGTKRNIAKSALYASNMPCLLKTSTALKLARAQEMLRLQGYGLMVWDAWRPPEAQLLLANHEGNGGLFLDPKTGWSRHCSGTAVDVTLVDKKGKEQPMPTEHDEGGRRASYIYTGHNPEIHRNLSILQQAMANAGFSLLDSEWWHFDDSDFLNLPMPVIFGHELGIYITEPKR